MSAAPAMQRAEGVLRIALRRRGAATALVSLRQQGCLKARFPHPDGDWREIVLINSSGGVAPGDTLDIALEVGAGGRVCLAGQAAERFYRAMPGSPPARLRCAIGLAPGAEAEWLPQESIFFEGTGCDRALDISMAEDARFLGVEMLVFGRTAMGERVTRASIRDGIRLRRGGRLVLQDGFRFDGDVAGGLAGPATLGGGGALATLVLAAPDSATRLDALREALAGFDAGASCRDGVLLARIAAGDGASLRRGVVAALRALRGGRRLPRMWMC